MDFFSFSNDSLDSQEIAKLALLGESISLIGQLILVYTAYLALLDEEQEENTYSELQAQIDSLKEELKQLKK